MHKLIVAALATATMASSAAFAQNAELRHDRREVREAQRDLRQAQRRGDRGDVREAREDLREARQEYREDWRDYRRDHRDVYRQRPYAGPSPAWRYRPVAPGYRFEPAYYGQRYWIGDPYRYRLPQPAPGFRWVRYGNDVVLVNMRNGRVVQVYNNFFW